MNYIVFTKLDTVQLRIADEIKHELTTIDFISRLKNAIASDVSKDQVVYNKENDTYEIFHNKKKYTVYYGILPIKKNSEEVDIVKELDELINLTERQKQEQGYDTTIKEIESRDLSTIINDGDEGVFYTEDDKVKYINHYKNNEAKESIFKGLSKVFTNPDIEWDSPSTILPGLVFLLASIAVAIVTSNPWFVLGLFYGGVDMFIGGVTDKSPLNFILMNILRSFQFAFLSIKNGIKKLIKKRRIKKLEETIDESELAEVLSNKIHKVNQNSESEDIKYTFRGESYEEIKKAVSKLKLIEDMDIRDRCGKDLDELIEKYKQTPKESQKQFSELLYQLSFLNGELSEELRKQTTLKVMDSNLGTSEETYNRERSRKN